MACLESLFLLEYQRCQQIQKSVLQSSRIVSNSAVPSSPP